MENTIKGKKMNMSQIFLETGRVVPVTIVCAETEVSPEMENKDVIVVGTSKGKGFAGVMKKWHFKGEMATRGQSDKQRSAGSIGGQTPGRVFPGKHMAGRMGNYRVTIKGLKIVKIDEGGKHIYVSGALPGARNSEITIKVLE